MTTTTSRKSISATARNLIIDLAIVTGFLVSLQPHFTGMAIHEWLGVLLDALILAAHFAPLALALYQPLLRQTGPAVTH
jgi:hypothetical protein